MTEINYEEEIKKCSEDPLYFINNYCIIPSATMGKAKFNTYDYQDDLVFKFEANRYNIILKDRQLGISTLAAAYTTWLLLFRDNQSCLSLVYHANAGLVRRFISNIYHDLPEWLKVAKIVKNNFGEFRLSNGSYIIETTAGQQRWCSQVFSLIVIDEASFVKGMDDLWQSYSPTISRGGRCIAYSSTYDSNSSNYDSNGWFEKTYEDAKAGLSVFSPTKVGF